MISPKPGKHLPLLEKADMRCEKFGKSDDPWLQRLLARIPRMVVVVAQVNRMTCQLWAMMTKE